MPRIVGRWEGDTAFTDLALWMGTDMWLFIGATTAPTLTRAAAGNYYYQCTSSQTVTAICPLSTFLQRTGYAQVAQEQFGSSSGGPSTYGPGPNQGYPPFTGSTQLTPTSAFFKKGIQVNDITLVYGITGAALTSQTMTFQKALYANTSAVAVTAITLSTATALATASTTNPYVTKISVSSPGFVVSDNTQLTIENTIVLPASAVYNLYGAMIHCSFNVA